MFERIGRGWGIAKASWSVLKLHPKLLVLPVFSGMALLLLIGSIVLSAFTGANSPRLHQWIDQLEHVKFDEPVVYGLMFVFYFVCSFIVIFFNAAMRRWCFVRWRPLPAKRHL